MDINWRTQSLDLEKRLVSEDVNVAVIHGELNGPITLWVNGNRLAFSTDRDVAQALQAIAMVTGVDYLDLIEW